MSDKTPTSQIKFVQDNKAVHLSWVVQSPHAKLYDETFSLIEDTRLLDFIHLLN